MYTICCRDGEKTVDSDIEIPGRFDGLRVLPNGLEIRFRTDLPDIIRETGKITATALPRIAAEYAAEGMKSPIRLTPEQYEAETERLADIAGQCLRKDFDWMSVLPLTRAGKLPKGRKISVAASDCVAVTANQSSMGYFGADRLQLMLVPMWTSRDGFIYGDVLPDSAALVLTDGPVASRTPPIFGRDGTASAPVTAKTSYLKDADVLPGSVYLSGKTEYLYLGRVVRPDDSNMCDDVSGRRFAYAHYMYIRMTKAVRDAVEGRASQESVFRAITDYSRAAGKYVSETCSVTKHPKKFTACTGTVAPPAELNEAGYYEFLGDVYEKTPERVWFVGHGDPHVQDGKYLM